MKLRLIPIGQPSVVARVVQPLLYYSASALLVLGGMIFGREHLKEGMIDMRFAVSFSSAFLSWDGMWYQRVTDHAYTYAPGQVGSIAFFPAYPVAAKALAAVTGVGSDTALVVVAHFCLLGAYVLFARYVGARSSDRQPACVGFCLLALSVWPTTVFFRMAYSESAFLLLAIAAMYAMQRGTKPLWVALIVGLATATRPVGIALLGPFTAYLWERSCAADGSEETARNRCLRFSRSAALWMPVACWGIVGFTAFQYFEFGDALAWAKTHQTWSRQKTAPYLDQWTSAIVLEPIWSVYDPSSVAYGARHDHAPRNAIFNLAFANPIYFVASVFLVWLGWHKRWLDGKEVLLAALLLGIPYFTHSYRHLMLSQGRFAAVAFPVYIVMGRLLARAPAPLVAVLCVVSAFLLAAYAALFAAGYRVT